MGSSVIVRDLDIVGVAINEAEADAPLIVDRDRVLPAAISLERVESVAWGNAEIAQLLSQINVLEATYGSACQIGREPCAVPCHVQVSRVTITESLDYEGNCTASRDACQGMERRLLRICSAAGGATRLPLRKVREQRE